MAGGNARSTLSLAAILESIVPFATRRAWYCSSFLLGMLLCGVPARAGFSPCTGLAERVFLPDFRDVHRVCGMLRTVCHPIVCISTFQWSHQAPRGARRSSCNDYLYPKMAVFTQCEGARLSGCCKVGPRACLSCRLRFGEGLVLNFDKRIVKNLD